MHFFIRYYLLQFSCNSLQNTVDYLLSGYTIIDFKNDLQAVSERLSLGAEIVARGHTSELSSASGAGRWATEKYSLSATLGNRGLDLCYARAIKPFLTVAAMLEVNLSVVYIIIQSIFTI